MDIDRLDVCYLLVVVHNFLRHGLMIWIIQMGKIPMTVVLLIIVTAKQYEMVIIIIYIYQRLIGQI